MRAEAVEYSRMIVYEVPRDVTVYNYMYVSNESDSSYGRTAPVKRSTPGKRVNHLPGVAWALCGCCE